MILNQNQIPLGAISCKNCYWCFRCFSGDVFIPKKADKQKKRKTKKVEDKMLGWGNFMIFCTYFDYSLFKYVDLYAAVFTQE
jgi:hypothetical protein